MEKSTQKQVCQQEGTADGNAALPMPTTQQASCHDCRPLRVTTKLTALWLKHENGLWNTTHVLETDPVRMNPYVSQAERLDLWERPRAFSAKQSPVIRLQICRWQTMYRFC
jgi:hypothetical protein